MLVELKGPFVINTIYPFRVRILTYHAGGVQTGAGVYGERTPEIMEQDSFVLMEETLCSIVLGVFHYSKITDHSVVSVVCVLGWTDERRDGHSFL